MINKPINPAPFNKCISNNSEEILRCDIPNNKLISASYTTISEVSSGETVFSDYKTYDIPQSSIEYMQKFDSLKNGNEYYWNTRYWSNPDKDGVRYNLINDCEKNKTECSLNLPNMEYIMDMPIFDYIFKETENMRHLYIKNWHYESFIPGKNYRDRLGYSNWLSGSYDDVDEFFLGKPSIQYLRDDYDLYKSLYNGFWEEIFDAYFNYVLVLCDKSNNMVAISPIFAAGLQWDEKMFIRPSNEQFVDEVIDICTFGEEEKMWISSYRYITTKRVVSLNDHTIKLYKMTGSQSLLTNGILKFYDNKVYSVVSSTILDDRISVQVYPPLQSDYVGGSSLCYYSSSNDYTNVSPDYYFRCKNEPIISITSSIIDGVITDIKGEFGIEYTLNEGDGLAPFNYFQLFFYGLNDEGKWMPIEKSPKLFDKNSTYCFNRFDNNRKYKVCAMCVDNDGDEWVSDEIIFKAEYQINYDYSIDNKYIFFDNEGYTVNINLENILASYSNPIWEVYKIESGAIVADFAGKNSGLFEYTKFKDYNIRNNVDYTYFVRIEYDGKLDEYSNNNEASGVEILCIGNIFTDFDGTCIIGLRKNPNGTYEIDGIFNLEYYFEDNMGEITQELSRSYIGGFDKFQKELKGSTNYIKGSAVGLLGNNANDEYFEPDKIRDKWLNFVNDDTLKMYKGFDGETILISISSSKIKPRYFNDSGLVNEVSISWQQTGTLENTAIFEVYG